jgi:hypothetical protein
MGFLNRAKKYKGPITPYSSFLGPEDKHRASPTLVELDQILDTLSDVDPGNAYWTRKQLRWAEKAAHDYMGLDLTK